MLMVFKMVSPNVRVINVGRAVARAGRDAAVAMYSTTMAACGRAGRCTWPEAVNRGLAQMPAGLRARILSILHSMGEGGKIWEGIYISEISKKPHCSNRGAHGVFIAGMDLGHADFRASGGTFYYFSRFREFDI